MFKLIKHDIGFKIRMAILVPLIINITYPALGRIVFENVDVLMGNSSDYKSELYDFIEKETKDDDIIFTVYDKNIIDLELLLNKPTYFNWKKIPSSSEAVIEWWRRYQLLEKIDDQMCKTELNYINYFIVEYNDKKLDNCGVIVFNNQEYKLIKNK